MMNMNRFQHGEHEDTKDTKDHKGNEIFFINIFVLFVPL